MNIIGKIFVFAVFVMSLVFMTFSVAIYSSHVNWREQIERTRDEATAFNPIGLKYQLEDVKEEREKLTTEINRLQHPTRKRRAIRWLQNCRLH